jgi:hypothetical protein
MVIDSLLREFGEGRGELTLFFDDRGSAGTRFHFEEFVHSHVRNRALAETFGRRPVVTCPVCREPVVDRLIQLRRDKGHGCVNCPACEARISLAADTEVATAPVPSSPALVEMDRNADCSPSKHTSAGAGYGSRTAVYICSKTAEMLPLCATFRHVPRRFGARFHDLHRVLESGDRACQRKAIGAEKAGGTACERMLPLGFWVSRRGGGSTPDRQRYHLAEADFGAGMKTTRSHPSRTCVRKGNQIRNTKLYDAGSSTILLN